MVPALAVFLKGKSWKLKEENGTVYFNVFQNMTFYMKVFILRFGMLHPVYTIIIIFILSLNFYEILVNIADNTACCLNRTWFWIPYVRLISGT